LSTQQHKKQVIEKKIQQHQNRVSTAEKFPNELWYFWQRRGDKCNGFW